MRNVLFVLSLIIIISCSIFYLDKIENSKTQIDHLEDILLPMKKHFREYSRIEYYSNRNSRNDRRAIKLYYNTQFAIAPSILVVKDCDAKIIIIDKQFDHALKIDTNVNKALLTNENKHFKAIFLEKRNIK